MQSTSHRTTKPPPIHRRAFLGQATALAAGLSTLATPRLQAADTPSRKLIVGVMGLSRGYDHVTALLQAPDVEVAWLCDADDQRLARAAKAVEAKQSKPARATPDFRRILDDPSVDALFIAAPNFWHTPATVLACAAGKHVYVEKPGSHNAQESEWIVAAARKGNRLVQMGTQRRSWPGIVEGMAKLREGVIGKVFSARCWYNNTRGSIGRGQTVPVPPHLRYDLWQGPVPERPYVDNLVHYNWHWRWHWGGGELANNGVHALDLARWGLGVEGPRRVTYNGGRYHYDDDQETPDTGVAVFDFGAQAICWDHSSCHPRRPEALPFVAFYGEGGTWINDGAGCKGLDLKGKPFAQTTGPAGDQEHIENFLNAIRGTARLHAEIAEGQKAALLCHLGNIAYRVGHTLHPDPTTGRISTDAEAMTLWRRAYRPGWEPKV
jgi:predicted dehydrogenase